MLEFRLQVFQQIGTHNHSPSPVLDEVTNSGQVGEVSNSIVSVCGFGGRLELLVVVPRNSLCTIAERNLVYKFSSFLWISVHGMSPSQRCQTRHLSTFHKTFLLAVISRRRPAIFDTVFIISSL